MAEAKKQDVEQDIADLEQALNEALTKDVPIAEPFNDSAALADEIETLRSERDQFQDKFMRALADAENMRKRADRDRREAEQYGGSKLARDLMPVYDSLKRATETVTKEQKEQSPALIEGIELTMRELLNIFAKHGITRIAPEIGDRFDPKLHEAMFEAPLPETKAGDIIQVSAEGFLLYDRILRPAKVGVSSMQG